MSKARKAAAKANKKAKQQAAPGESLNQASLLKRALEWFLEGDSLQNLATHGNVDWTATALVTLAVLWTWSDNRTLTGAFLDAKPLAIEMFGTVAVGSYQGLMAALRRYSAELLKLVWALLHRRMERVAGEHWRIGMWLALAVDGSRVTTPRTQSNERAFAAQNYGRGKKARSRKKWKNKKRRSKKLSEPVKPQMWLTLFWHMGLKLPWCWRTGPSTASERAHVLEMLDLWKFPENTLFCGDAGFVGYEFWSTLQQRGHHFLVRVGGNVRLLKKLGTARHRGDLVHLWPDDAARKKLPPIVLRLLVFQGPRGLVYLVTNVLDPSQLSLCQASQLYRLRWGLELQFRALKQTFGRTKLRSRTAENADVELQWSLVGLTLVQRFAIKEQLRIDSPPANSSVALALAVLQDAVRNWSRAVHDPRELTRRLQAATKDPSERHGSKRARYRPQDKDKPSATAPIITLATETQRRAYETLRTAA